VTAEEMILIAAATNVATGFINLTATILKIYADKKKTPHGGTRKRSKRKKRR
jgi:hypothetical protein